MQRVLSRAVRCGDGVEYPEGTAIELCPEENRESLITSGWTKLAGSALADTTESTVEEVAGTESADEVAVESESEQSQEAAGEPGTEAGSDSAGSEADSGDSDETAAEPTDESTNMPERMIAELDLADDLKTKLAEAGIETVTQATEYRQAHGSFRTIKGIGKAGDQAINEAIQ